MVAKPLKTKHFAVGDNVYLECGETCSINRKAVTKDGTVFYMLTAKHGAWAGSIWLTEREMLLNVR